MFRPSPKTSHGWCYTKAGKGSNDWGFCSKICSLKMSDRSNRGANIAKFETYASEEYKSGK